MTELLVVIGLMGILAAIAIAMMAVHFDEAHVVTAKRNAQTLAAVASGARAAGDVSLSTASDATQAAIMVKAGLNGSGPFSEMEFAVPLLTTEQIAEAAVFLELGRGTHLFGSTVGSTEAESFGFALPYS